MKKLQHTRDVTLSESER